jgi:hypothetical protein
MFNVMKIRDGIVVFYRTATIDQPGLKEHGFGQCRFTGLGTAQQDYVFDVLVVVHFHSKVGLMDVKRRNFAKKSLTGALLNLQNLVQNR